MLIYWKINVCIECTNYYKSMMCGRFILNPLEKVVIFSIYFKKIGKPFANFTAGKVSAQVNVEIQLERPKLISVSMKELL